MKNKLCNVFIVRPALDNLFHAQLSRFDLKYLVKFGRKKTLQRYKKFVMAIWWLASVNVIAAALIVRPSTLGLDFYDQTFNMPLSAATCRCRMAEISFRLFQHKNVAFNPLPAQAADDYDDDEDEHENVARMTEKFRKPIKKIETLGGSFTQL